jgi:phosphoglycolate phosphatase-like HAD superfamily hydrolase
MRNKIKNNNRNIFLDLDETLIDTSERHYQVYCDIINILNLKDPLNKDEFWKFKRNGIKTNELINETNHQIKKEFSKLWIENIEEKEYLLYDRPFCETFELLSKLSKERLILVTMRNNRKHLIWELKNLGLYEYFESILNCSPLKNETKKIPILEYIQEKKLYLDKNSIIIGDSEIDILTGRKLDMTVIAVSYGMRTRKMLSNMNPDYCLNNINQLLETINGI